MTTEIWSTNIDDHRNMVNNWVQNKMKDVKSRSNVREMLEKCDRKCRYFLGNKCLRNKIWDEMLEKCDRNPGQMLEKRCEKMW